MLYIYTLHHGKIKNKKIISRVIYITHVLNSSYGTLYISHLSNGLIISILFSKKIISIYVLCHPSLSFVVVWKVHGLTSSKRKLLLMKNWLVLLRKNFADLPGSNFRRDAKNASIPFGKWLVPVWTESFFFTLKVDNRISGQLENV